MNFESLRYPWLPLKSKVKDSEGPSVPVVSPDLVVMNIHPSFTCEILGLRLPGHRFSPRPSTEKLRPPRTLRPRRLHEMPQPLQRVIEVMSQASTRGRILGRLQQWLRSQIKMMGIGKSAMFCQDYIFWYLGEKTILKPWISSHSLENQIS